MILFGTGISLFTYIYPSVQIQNDIVALTKVSDKHGGLTYEDIDIFQNTLVKYDYLKEKTSEVIITAETTPSKILAVGVTPMNEIGNDYIKKTDNELIEITVKVPANNNGLTEILDYWKIIKSTDYYTYKATSVSQRD